MKTKKTSMKKGLMVFSTIALLAGGAGNAYSQDGLLEDTESILNNEQIDIDGAYTRRQSAADKLEKMRKQLERQNEDMVSKKIEDMRMKEEQKLAGKLKKAFRGGDSVSQRQSAVAKTPVVQAAAPVVEKEQKNNKIIPRLGVTNYKSDDVDFESSIHTSLSFESMVTPNVSVGVKFAYSKMSIEDVKLNANNGGFGYGQFGSYNFNSFNNSNNLEMDYRGINLEVNSKYYVSVANKIKPYVGAGLGYNRSKLSYTDKSEKEINNYLNGQFGGFGFNNNDLEMEDYSTSLVSGSVNIGAEIDFSDTIGMGLDFEYQKALTSGSESDVDSNNNGFGNNNTAFQNRLDEVGESIEDSHRFAITAGLVVKF